MLQMHVSGAEIVSGWSRVARGRPAVSVKSLHSLALATQSNAQHMSHPLPAEEQLALLFHLADIPPHIETANQQPAVRTTSLAQAYATCQRITRQHSKSFFFSTQFLPSAKRQAIRALYAFCRTSDDIVDLAKQDPTRALADWVHLVRAPLPPTDSAVLQAWHDTRIRYQIPAAYVDELLAGIAMDLTINRYETFADLWLYCYRVASVVGLLSMQIIGAAPGAESYAIKLGMALQLTNILRDVGEDAGRGRVYLPNEDLRRFGLSAEDILAGVCDERFVALMQFEIARAHRLYNESWAGVALLSADSRLAVGAAAQIYRGILDKIVANNYDVYTKRAHLTASEKLRKLPQIWYAVQQLDRQVVV